MIDPATFGAFVFTAVIIVISPGPDTMLLLRYTMNGGRRIGLATVAGIQLGMVAHTVLAVAGLSLIIAKSPLLFKLIAVGGALYLAYLAIQALRAGMLRIRGDAAPLRISGWRAMRDAFVTNMLNPKVILLFIALFPNFVDPRRDDVWMQLIVLGAVLIAINFMWLIPLAAFAGLMRRWLGTAAVQRGVNWATFSVFMSFAVLMVLEHVFHVF
ncbi:MAG: LysE family translocator [Alphaproteobacteria bacterium]